MQALVVKLSVFSRIWQSSVAVGSLQWQYSVTVFSLQWQLAVFSGSFNA
jgi:hypothetical protein